MSDGVTVGAEGLFEGCRLYGLYKDNGNNHFIIEFMKGLYKDDGQENGSYYFGFGI